MPLSHNPVAEADFLRIPHETLVMGVSDWPDMSHRLKIREGMIGFGREGLLGSLQLQCSPNATLAPLQLPCVSSRREIPMS